MISYKLRSQAMIHHLWHLAIFNNWSMRGSSFKQLALSKSLQGFALLASVKSNSSNCSRAKGQLFWSHCRQLSFSTSQWVKRKICVQKHISYKEKKPSQYTKKQKYELKMTWKHSDYYYLSNREMIEVVFSSRVSLLVLYFWEIFKPATLFTRIR